MQTVAYWRDLAERVLATSAQSFIAYVGADALNVMTFNWAEAGALTAGAAVLSVAKALAAKRVGSPDDASLLPGGTGKR